MKWLECEASASPLAEASYLRPTGSPKNTRTSSGQITIQLAYAQAKAWGYRNCQNDALITRCRQEYLRLAGNFSVARRQVATNLACLVL
jgi:hypothetical protein